VRTVFKSKMTAIIHALPIRDVLRNMLPALVVRAGIPVFAVPAALHVLAAVGTNVGPLHFDALEIDFIGALETEMVSFFQLWYVHDPIP
jgi:hypothetical protein